jgi:hypothetical protein
MSTTIMNKPTRAQLEMRERLERSPTTLALRDLVAAGRIIDSGKRRWIEATGRYEIVWIAPEFKQ